MNFKLPNFKFNQNTKYRENFDQTFGSKQAKMTDFETHVRRCPVCRLSTTKSELCQIGKLISDKGESK